jgi:hypothetical protein
LSAAQLASFREVCPVYAAYRPEPNDSPDNLAAVVERTLETCAKQTTCKAVSTCLGEGKCMWVYKSPTSDPLFMCM